MPPSSPPPPPPLPRPTHTHKNTQTQKHTHTHHSLGKSKCHADITRKAPFSNIRETDSRKILQNLPIVLSILYNDDKIRERKLSGMF